MNQDSEQQTSMQAKMFKIHKIAFFDTNKVEQALITSNSAYQI